MLFCVISVLALLLNYRHSSAAKGILSFSMGFFVIMLNHKEMSTISAKQSLSSFCSPGDFFNGFVRNLLKYSQLSGFPLVWIHYRVINHFKLNRHTLRIINSLHESGVSVNPQSPLNLYQWESSLWLQIFQYYRTIQGYFPVALFQPQYCCPSRSFNNAPKGHRQGQWKEYR